MSRQPTTRKAAASVADQLRRTIVREGTVGDRLESERALLEGFEVSRPTLREALSVLEAEGLVELRRGARGGVLVRQPSIAEIGRQVGVFLQLQGTTHRDVFVVRRIVEPVAAGLAADRVDPAGMAEVRRTLDEERQALDDLAAGTTTSARAVGDRAVAFHDAVLAASGSTTLQALGQVLGALNASHVHGTLDALAEGAAQLGALRRSHAAHERIAHLVAAGDRTGATGAMAEHVEAIVASAGPDVNDADIDVLEHRHGSTA